MAHDAVPLGHILRVNIGLVHGQRYPVALHKMRRGGRMEDLRVRPSDDVLRAFHMRVIGEGLVAGQIDAGLRVLCEAHGGHVVQQRIHRLLFSFYRDLRIVRFHFSSPIPTFFACQFPMRAAEGMIRFRRRIRRPYRDRPLFSPPRRMHGRSALPDPAHASHLQRRRSAG